MGGIVANVLTGGFLDGVSKVIDSIRGKSPEDAAKLAELQEKYQQDFLDTQTTLAQAKINENIQLNSIAGQNVQADAKSGDKYTSRARPSVIYVGLAVILWNYCLIPVLLYRWKFQPVVLPDMVWQAWLYISLGVVFTRTMDKASAGIFGGSGGSVNLPFGMKAESKGD